MSISLGRRRDRPAATARRRTAAGVQPDLDGATALAMDLMALAGTSGQESGVAQFIRGQLLAAGADETAIRTDDVASRSPLGGEVGNLAFTLPGTRTGPRRLLMAHMDTVPLCVGSRPVRQGRLVRSGDRSTGLGADNRAGCGVVLTAALEILRRGLDHPPLTFLWTVQEEVGLFGAHYGDLSLLEKPKLAFNWDGGPPDKLTIGATGAYRLSIEVRGIASHAGGAPERGVSAVTIAGLAIAELARQGWLGDVRRGRGQGTSNIGVIQGGAATNVVAPLVELRAEARSHNPRFRRRIVEAMEEAFAKAAASVRNVDGASGKVKLKRRLDYEAFLLEHDEPCVLAAEAAVRASGGEPLRAITNGGLDANWLTARGVPTVTLGCGQKHVHTTAERLDVGMYQRACRIGLLLATATERDGHATG